MFLIKVCKLDQKDIVKVCSMRNRQEVWISFTTDELANQFERRLLSGIDWGDGQLVTGQRLDMPSLYIKLRGAADDIGEDVISETMSKFGEIVLCTKGTASMGIKYDIKSNQSLTSATELIDAHTNEEEKNNHDGDYIHLMSILPSVTN